MGGTSWLTAVKKVFRSPTKQINDKKSGRRTVDHEQEEEEKKRGKRRWIFKKPTYQETIIQHYEAREASNGISEAADAEQRHAIAVAMAKTAAAQAAIATAQAAAEVVRLTRPTRPTSVSVGQHMAAIVIQTAFRGYLARRALRALKGLVKLQALVRGHNVRRRANKTLRCMQALVRVQARVRDHRKRLSSRESSLGSMLSDPNSLWGSHFADRKSINSGDESSWADERIRWDEQPQTLEEIKNMLQNNTKERALRREEDLAHVFSKQMWKPRDGHESEGDIIDESISRRRRPRWEITRCSNGRMSCDQILREPIKTVEIDTYTKSNHHHHHQQQQHRSVVYSAASPLHGAHRGSSVMITPSPYKTRSLQVHSASPRCQREEKVHTPTQHSHRPIGVSSSNVAGPIPNYMAATESTKARFRSQSAPRQRPSTPERDKPCSAARKRLSFPVPKPGGVNDDGDVDYEYESKSPSFKDVHGCCNSNSNNVVGIEQRWNMCSYPVESVGDEITFPPLNSDLRKWLR